MCVGDVVDDVCVHIPTASASAVASLHSLLVCRRRLGSCDAASCDAAAAAAAAAPPRLSAAAKLSS